MSNDAQQPEPKKPSMIRRLRDKIGDGAIAAIATLVLAGGGFLFKPIGDYVLDFFPDKGRVERIDGPDQLIVGEKFELDPYITPIGKLKHAVLKVTRSANIAQLPQQSIFTLGEVGQESAFSRLKGGKALQFQALEEGEASVVCDLLSGDRPIGKSLTRRIPIVRHHEYSGEWMIQIGATPGTMHLEETPDDDATLYGIYALKSDIHGLVSGKFDGAKFAGSFSIGDSPSRFQILGDTSEQRGKINVTGQATLYQAAGGNWIPIADQQPLTLRLTKK